jgi:hypothetical protein
MRYIKQGIVRDGEGRIVSGALVRMFLAGTTTPANIYTTSTTMTVVNSVTSGLDGSFVFYVDDTDYSLTQLFKIVLSYSSRFNTQTWDGINIFSSTGTIFTGSLGVYCIVLKQTMTTDIILPYSDGFKTILLLDSNGAVRNVDFSGSYPIGYEVYCRNYGQYDIILDSVDTAIKVSPLEGISVYFDGVDWLSSRFGGN